MKKFIHRGVRSFLITNAFIGALALVATTAVAQPVPCADLFSQPTAIEISSSNSLAYQRQTLIEQGTQQGLPLFEIDVQGASVPVILLNKKTLPAWDSLMKNSFGMVQLLNPGEKADHGYIRLPGAVVDGTYDATDPNRAAALVDLYSPGGSGRNALNGTGYRYKEMAKYFNIRKADSGVHVDLAYPMSKSDLDRVWLYQLSKRIALVRIQYAFDEANNYWISQQRRVLQQDGSFRDKMTGGFEQCNNSRLCSNIQAHSAEMRGRLSRLLSTDINTLYSLPEGKAFLDAAKADLLKRDWRDAAQFDPNFLDQQQYLAMLDRHFNPNLSHEAKVDALSYFLAINVFEEVAQIRERLGIFEGRESQYGNPNYAAILIYSDSPGAVQNFYFGKFEYFGGYGGDGQTGGNGFSHTFFNVHMSYPNSSLPSNWSNYVP